MGSCIFKRTKAESRTKPKSIDTVSLYIMSSNEYLKPEIRDTIFRLKDSKAPSLKIELSNLYMRRRVHFASY